jgi:hypothetical protein
MADRSKTSPAPRSDEEPERVEVLRERLWQSIISRSGAMLDQMQEPALRTVAAALGIDPDAPDDQAAG